MVPRQSRKVYSLLDHLMISIWPGHAYLHNCISNNTAEPASAQGSGFLRVHTVTALPDILIWTVSGTYAPTWCVLCMFVSSCSWSQTVPQMVSWKTPGDCQVAISTLILQEQHATSWQFGIGVGLVKVCLPSNYSPVTNLLIAVPLPRCGELSSMAGCACCWWGVAGEEV